jgi:RNA polymerase sigma-70 factor, ECF subfamily
MVQTHSDTDDILQNTFIKVYRGISGFEGKSKLSTWLYRIAMNETITFCQNNKRKITDSLDAHAFPISEMTSQDGIDGEKVAQMLSAAIEELPEKQRVVFNLRYFDEMPYEEMSEVLDTSVGALKASYHHAVKKVERFIQEQERLSI